MLRLATAVLRSRRNLLLENVALRHQLLVLSRNPKRPRLKPVDRVLWVWLSLVGADGEPPLDRSTRHRDPLASAGLSPLLEMEKPARKAGRKSLAPETIALIRNMSRANPLWGAPRIHGELLKLGITVAQRTVSKYMVRPPRRSSTQNWTTFLRNHLGQMVSVDFLTVPTLNFHVLYVFIVLSHLRRQILHFNVTATPRPVGPLSSCVKPFPSLSHPNTFCGTGTAFMAWTSSTSQALGFEQLRIAPRSPWQSPYVERLIGSLRRECLDHVIVLNRAHLHRVLESYFAYYHGWRTHLGLDKDTPEPRQVQRPKEGKIVAFPEVGGLHHHYERRAA